MYIHISYYDYYLTAVNICIHNRKFVFYLEFKLAKKRSANFSGHVSDLTFIQLLEEATIQMDEKLSEHSEAFRDNICFQYLVPKLLMNSSL